MLPYDDTSLSYTYTSNNTGGYILTWPPPGANGPTGSTSNITITTNGASGGGGSFSQYNYASSSIDDGNLKVKGDIEFNGKSLSKLLETIEKRLAILTPDPKKLEQFEALQKAYDNYKVLEALCQLPENDDDK